MSARGAKYATFAKATARSDRHPIEDAGFFKWLFFYWANPLLRTGNDRQLDPDDLWPLQAASKCDAVVTSFEPAFKMTQSLVKTFFRIFGWRFFWIGCMQLLAVPCTLYGPYVLQQLLEGLASGLPSETMVTYVCTLFGVQVFAALLAVHMDYLDKVIVVRLTSGIQHLLFQKALRLDAASRKVKSAGEISNHFTSDINWIISMSYYSNYLWILPVQIGITLYMLFNIISWAAFVGLGVILLVMPITNVLVNRGHEAFETLMEQKDARMKVVNEVFGAIQILKFNAWEEQFQAKIAALRAKELSTLVRIFNFMASNITLAYAVPALVTVSSFATYSLVLQEPVTPAKVFSALALFNSLKSPLNNFPHTITGTMQALVALKRIAEYLAMAEKATDIVDTPASLPPADREALAAANVAIAVEDGRFGWDATKPFFTDLNLRVRTGELVVVHGAVGEGKSSLCAVLLGELEKQRGSVFVGGRVSYFSQQPWIQNLTIRENILFGKPYDRTKYAAVLEACALTKDLAAFPAGDRTEIGQKGVNVSGGQKARIALARACYNDGDIFLLDSPLSAVDAIVSNEIFTKCFLGLLSRKTVFLVTHNPEIIASKHVDRTIEIKDGRCLDTVNVAKEPFASPIAPLPARAADDALDADDGAPALSRVAPHLLSPSLRSPYLAGGLHEMVYTPRERPDGTFEEPLETGKLVDEEFRSEGRVAPSVFAAYFRAAGGWRVIVWLLLVQSTWQGLAVCGDLWLSHWSASAALQSSAEFTAAAGWNVGIYACFSLGSASIVLVRVLSVGYAGRKASRALFDQMTAALLRAPMKFFDTNPTGRILNRFSGDFNALDVGVPFSFMFVLATFFIVLFAMGTTIVVVRSLSFFILPLFYVYYRVGAFYLQPAREIERLGKVTYSPMINLISEAIDGAVVVRAFGAKQERRFQRLHHRNVDRYNESIYAKQIVEQWFMLQNQLLSASLILVISLSLVYARAILSPGLVGLVFNYALNVPLNLQYLIQDASEIEKNMVSPERIIEYTAIAPEAPRVVAGAVSTQTWPSAGAIEFRQVSFRYKETDPLVLKDVSVSLRGREKLGLVGRTGAGKSSLTMALFRINELTGGQVLIDGVDCAGVGLKTLRQSIAIIPQNPVLFKGSLRQYLDPFEQFADDALWGVLRKVDLVERTAEAGLATAVEENGDNFSVGERQMLCMARALLLRAKVVVMDEATAAMDHETDQRLQQVIRSEFADSTVLTIAHRLDTVLDCDRILVFDHGRLVQCDTPAALIAQGDGIFYELCDEGGYLDKLKATP
ncbi:multidrug resistance-associated protein 1 [Achlya hypogyna]|uniref:Multidrug resistance-associated protein 1 n=1 Tax=Achlya hypogyna TaxID=1202772 RepID=A0A1V9YX89_ACHHY|nr:multidrug resistance-associated protein 1 [Achlya hypogyna]